MKMWSLLAAVACITGVSSLPFVEILRTDNIGPAYNFPGGALGAVYNIRSGVGPAYIVDGVSPDTQKNVDLSSLAYHFDDFDTSVKDPVLGYDPDAALNVTQIIARWDYPVENHIVTTKDGYILQIQRIPHGRKHTNTNKNRRVIYLQHGLFSSSFDFVNNLPNESLGFILADHGYDVWLGNVRGNTYGRRHVKLDPDTRPFWEFTFDEFIAYDVPAIIDYILATTGEESLYYIGHSQGTTVMFGLLASMPEYSTKIRAFAALAPVANVTSITTPIRWLAPLGEEADWLLERMGWGELMPNSRIFKFLGATLCAHSISRELCEAVVFLTSGLDSKQLNASRIPVYVSHTPAGTSVRNVVHFGQELLQARFQKYDFGQDENMKRYGRRTPPEYDTRQIKNVPMGFFCSKNDWFADANDVDYLMSTVSTLKQYYMVPDPYFTHLDFIIGIRAADSLYPAVLDFLARY